MVDCLFDGGGGNVVFTFLRGKNFKITRASSSLSLAKAVKNPWCEESFFKLMGSMNYIKKPRLIDVIKKYFYSFTSDWMV